MAPLSQKSARALVRLRNYVPPASVYQSLPLSRRAAVLVLLFADRDGDLRVVLTVRSNNLNTYAGHVAFPGGRADTLFETPFQTARRETFEEIGLPKHDRNLPPPFRVEHLCELPTSLAYTEVGVRPCVSFLGTGHVHGSTSTAADAEKTLIPRLQPKEVSTVFSAPFHNFLLRRDEASETASSDPAEAEKWYEGSWGTFHGSKWRMHNFHVPSDRHAPPSERVRYRVFGLTARILVDVARVAYGEEPEFEFSRGVGEEDLIRRMLEKGRLKGERGAGDRLSTEEVGKYTKL